MSKKITRSSKVPFGRPGNKGRKLSEQPDSYVNWIATKLWDTDKHMWAIAAKEEMKYRKKENAQIKSHQELEDAADAFLKKNNINPKTLNEI